VLPDFTTEGILPAGIHSATWADVEQRLGFTPRRRQLLGGLHRAITALHQAGCRRIYINGSFVTAKPNPNDFDCCWEEAGVDPKRLDPVLLDFTNKRERQKLKYGGEMFPASAPADTRRSTFVAFFQNHKETGTPKGIVAIDLDRWQP
jgi:hypothetical protein